MKINSTLKLLFLWLITTLVFNSCKKDKNSQTPKYFEGDEVSSNFDVVFNGAWAKHSLKWYTYRYSNKISEAETREVFTKAFKRWSDVADISFEEVFTQDKADITLGFVDDGNHWITATKSQCPLIMNVSNTLAHAFPPNQISATDKLHEGDIHFLDKWPWTPYGTSGSGGQLSLLAVTIHEIGHSLGLSHSDDADDIMYKMNQNITNLSNNDVKRIVNLYGAKTSNSKSNIAISGNYPQNIVVGSSQNFKLTISNSGNTALSISDYSIENNSGSYSFVYSKPSFPLNIQPNGSYEVTMAFQPSSEGTFNSTFKVLSNASNGSGSFPLASNGILNTNCGWTLSSSVSGSNVTLVINGSYSGQMYFSSDLANWQTSNTFNSQTSGTHNYYAKTDLCSYKTTSANVTSSGSNVQSNPSINNYTTCDWSNWDVQLKGNTWLGQQFRMELTTIDKTNGLLVFQIIPCNQFTINSGYKIKFETYESIQGITTNSFETSVFSSSYTYTSSAPQSGLSNENFSTSQNRQFFGLITVSDQYNNVIARYCTKPIAVWW